MNNGTRTSYADRDAVIERLRVAAGDGMLDPDELDARIEAATAAKTFGQLARLTTDLPRACAAAARQSPLGGWRTERARARSGVCG